MAPHSSTLAWKIPWTEEPGRLQSMGLLIDRHDWATSLSLFTFMHWRRKWQPTPVFLPGESQGRRNLMGCHLWGCTESDTTKWLSSSSSRIVSSSSMSCYEVSNSSGKWSNGKCRQDIRYFVLKVIKIIINFYVRWKPGSLQMVIAAMKLKDA